MLKITTRIRIDDAWEDIVTPDALSERIAMMEEMAGKDVVIKVETSNTELFLCGTEALAQTMAKVKKDCVCMTLTEAHKNIEHNTEAFCVAIGVFSCKKDVDKLFPKAEGWDHLKEAQ